MKKLFLTVLLLVIGFTSFAQTEKREDGLITVMLLRTLPTGDFRETDITKDVSGFAKPGAAFGFGYTYFFRNKNKPNAAFIFGSSISILKRNNGFDAEKMAASQTGTGPDIITATDWKANFLLAGFVLKDQVDNSRLFTHLRVNFGVAFTTSPEIVFTYNSGNQSETKTESKCTSFAYGYDAGFRYNFGKLGLGLETNMLFTKPEFEYAGKKQKQALNSMGLGFSLSYILNFDRSLKL